jgi:hypothetical protein
MLCTQFQLRRQEVFGDSVKLLPCRNWHCEFCQPNRLKQLRAMAAAGLPNICLTLTINTSTGDSPTSRYQALHNAWKLLVKRILREFAKPAEKRWVIKTEEAYDYQQIADYHYTSSVKPHTVKRLHYMAFPEETEAGEPHLHILLRTKYIPQRWISQQMQNIINSPIVWIEKIKGPRAAIAYVTKYVTKAPAQFGKSKRYWCSRFFQIVKRVREETQAYSRRNSQLVRQPFHELISEIVTRGLFAVPLSRTEIELRRLRDVRDKQGTYTKGLSEEVMVKAYLWLGSWRQRCAV